MQSPYRRPRVLVVLAHFDDTRNPNGRPSFVPQGVGHAFLAGAFNRESVDVRIYSEFHSGPLIDEAVFAWPDMLVLTGVTSAFDRMRQLSAYVRTKSPSCVVVAGGPVTRSLPKSSARFFDYVCNGDVEELIDVATDVFGPQAGAEELMPRFDLLGWRSPVNYVESSRYCNFRCSFCSLTGEGRKYSSYDLSYVEQQIRAYKIPKPVLFIDNNFYGNNRSHFHDKLDLLKDLRRQGILPGWLALVTGDFFSDPGNLERAKESGCLGLFSGIESFDENQIRLYNKKQNIVPSQIDMISSCLKSGVVFQYGLMFDPATQTLKKMQEELSFILSCSQIPLPAFLSVTIPLLGTPYFRECVDKGRFLPLAKLRDMDGFTLLTKPLDDLKEVAPFVRGMARLDGRAGQVLKHSFKFFRTYRSSLTARQMASTIANSARLCMPELVNNRRRPTAKGDERLTYVTTTQPLGPLYRPAFNVSARYSGYFTPTMITDAKGEPHPDILEAITVNRRANLTP